MKRKAALTKGAGRIVSAGIIISMVYLFLIVSTGRADYYNNGLRYLYQHSYAPLNTDQFRLYYTGTYGNQESGGSLLPNSYEQQIGVSYGATDHIDVEAYSTLYPVGQAVGTNYAGGGSLRYYQATGYVDIGGVADYHLDWTGASIEQLTCIVSKTMGRLNMTANSTAAHTFTAHKDAVDMYFNAGASYTINRYINFGIESQANDLEAAFQPDEAEGGTSLTISPVLVIIAADVNLLLGPGVEIKNGITTRIIRATLTKTF